MLAGAQLKGRLAGDLEVVVGNDVGGPAVVDAEGGSGSHQAGGQAGDDGRETHVVWSRWISMSVVESLGGWFDVGVSESEGEMMS